MKMKLKYTVFFAAILAANVALAQMAKAPEVPSYEVLPRSKLSFTATMNSALTDGEFKEFKADIKFLPSDLLHSNIRLEIAMNSVSSAYPAVAENLKKKEWFDTEKFPTAVFESESIIGVSQENYVAKGKLTLRGITKPLEVPFLLHTDELGVARANVNITLKRSDFGIGTGEWKKFDVVKDEVVVRGDIEARVK